MSMLANYYKKFDNIVDKYMESPNEGSTKASQIVTAVDTLIYEWITDGYVFDTQEYYSWKKECVNALPPLANWLQAFPALSAILYEIKNCTTPDEYEELLKKLADTALNEEFLAPYVTQRKEGSIYTCEGYYTYVRRPEDMVWDEEEEEEED